MPTDAFGYLAAGMTLGLGAGLSPGPLLTLVLVQTLTHGTREGAKVAFSPLLTDVPILCAALIAMSWITAHPEVMGGVSLAGAIVVALFGVDCFKVRAITVPTEKVNPGSVKKGVLTNFANPHVYIFWATVGAPTTIQAWHVSHLAPFLFLGGFYCSLIGAKITVSIIAGRCGDLLSSRAYLLVMRFLGLALFAFALFLVRDGLRLLGLFG